MTTGYGQKECPIARALDVIGEKWSLLIEAGLPGVAPNTLSARLKMLETQGVIATRLYERHPPRYEYLVTAKGKSLGPVLKALGAWGAAYA
jgi:DNA-binding HxlR family transcriptional regulator